MTKYKVINKYGKSVTISDNGGTLYFSSKGKARSYARQLKGGKVAVVKKKKTPRRSSSPFGLNFGRW